MRVASICEVAIVHICENTVVYGLRLWAGTTFEQYNCKHFWSYRCETLVEFELEITFEKQSKWNIVKYNGRHFEPTFGSQSLNL